MVGVFLILAIISIILLIVNLWCLLDGDNKIDVCLSCMAFGVIFVISVHSVICSAFAVDGGYESIFPLLGHIDKDKTKTSETNGEITGLWITVDGKEYSFELKHEGENEHGK